MFCRRNLTHRNIPTAKLFGAWSFPCLWQPILDRFVSVTLIGQTGNDLHDCVKYAREARALPLRRTSISDNGEDRLPLMSGPFLSKRHYIQPCHVQLTVNAGVLLYHRRMPSLLCTGVKEYLWRVLNVNVTLHSDGCDLNGQPISIPVRYTLR